MKLLLLIALLALTGCQTTGILLQGAGQGLQQSSQNRQVNCTTNQYGQTYYSNCR